MNQVSRTSRHVPANRAGDRSVRTSHATPGGARATALAAFAALAVADGAHASFLPPELMDKAAMWLAWFVIIFVPIGGIVLFWLGHVLPEKIAHKRHHPQRDAIQTLCLLSLVFGGLLWPIAWLWAYTKPAGYRLAYGTEKHDDYYREMAERAQAGELEQHELDHLRAELDAIDAKGALTAPMRTLRKSLATAHAAPSAPPSAQAAPAVAGTSGGGA
jgi:CBS domain containing-hemolysin-like protein